MSEKEMTNQEAIEKLKEACCFRCVYLCRNMDECENINCPPRRAIEKIATTINDYDNMHDAWSRIITFRTKEASDRYKLMKYFDEMVDKASEMTENQKTAYIEALGRIFHG